MPHIRTLCYVVYNNHHVTPIYNALCELPNFSCQRVSWGRLPAARVALGWGELDDNSGYLLGWKHLFRHIHLAKLSIECDVAVIPGPFTAPALNFFLRILGKRVYAYSEPFLMHPRTSKTAGSLMLRRLFLRFLDRPKFTLLEMGRGAHLDYRTLGMKRFRAIEFCFSVTPKVRADYPIRGAERPKQGADVEVSILFVGSIDGRKGLDLLLKALAGISLPKRKWKLSVVGSGPALVELRRYCVENNLEDNVQFHGALSRPQCDQMYARSDLLVVPSRFDGWAAVVNEGMEMGLAVVASDMVGSSRQLIENGVTGGIFTAGNSDELASVLDELLNSSDRLTSMKERAVIKIKNFRPTHVAKRLARVIEADIAGTHPEIQNGIGKEIYGGST